MPTNYLMQNPGALGALRLSEFVSMRTGIRNRRLIASVNQYAYQTNQDFYIQEQADTGVVGALTAYIANETSFKYVPEREC